MIQSYTSMQQQFLLFIPCGVKISHFDETLYPVALLTIVGNKIEQELSYGFILTLSEPKPFKFPALFNISETVI